jgi:hypothetical protein
MLCSRNFVNACILSALGAAAATARADLVWTPAFNASTTGSTAPNGVLPFQTATGLSNWADTNNGNAMYVGAISPSVAINKNLVVNAGYVNCTSQTGTNLWLGQNGSLTVTGGFLRFTGANNTTVYGYISNGGGIDAAGQPPVNISGGTVWVTAVQDVAVTLSGNGTLRLGGNGGGNSVTAGGSADPIAFTATVNIISDAATLEFARKSVAGVVTDHVSTHEILVDGNPLVQNTATYPSPWNGNSVITQAAYNQYTTFTTVRRQTDWIGSCANSGACTITYQSACVGTWTQGGSCAGRCVDAASVCTPVTTSAACTGTYTRGVTCTPGLSQPADASFETTDCSMAYGNGSNGLTCSISATLAYNTQVAGWYDGDDYGSRVYAADGTNIPATIHGGGSKWGSVTLPPNSIHLGGLWTRIGNYDPAHGDYKIAMDVGDRSNATFTYIGVALYTGNFTPLENTVPGELGGTPFSTAGNTGAQILGTAITWSDSSATAARTGSIVATIPNVPNLAGVAPQAGDALYVLIYDNNPNDVALFDNVTVLGSCCDTSMGCTMTAPGACTSPSSFNQNGSCTPNNPCTAGVCCRGATCNATVSQASCAGNTLAGAAFVASSSTCNAAASTTTPCCYADYNKVGGIGVQDIFDFLNDWFAASKFAVFGGDGVTGTPTVQNIFDFLNAWFAGGC